MKISFIQPARDNLKYLKWSYNSIRKNQGPHTVEICIADDFSHDGTWEWCEKKMKADSNFKAIRNEGPTRLGHTILYDRLVNTVATSDICMIFHADMYLCPGALDSIEHHLTERTIVSLTRIEPPLHPPGPEKIFLEGGATEPEDFNEKKFLKWLEGVERKPPTHGIFAPWAFFKKDFQEIGGHDPLYAPQSKEDTDIFNRFQLNGVELIQTWEGFVYHMTCRGSRFNPSLTTVGKDSNEWERQNARSTRNFIRKWGHFCKHDEYMKPIIPPKYDAAYVINNCTAPLLEALEPWASKIYINDPGLVEPYVKAEQPNTAYDLSTRIFSRAASTDHDIIVYVDGAAMTQQDFGTVQNLSQILYDHGQLGKVRIGSFVVDIKALKDYSSNLIVLGLHS